MTYVAGRVTTRGYYDRRTGAALRTDRYSLYPPGLVKKLAGSEEIAIMVHGMRNDSAGASSKVRIASEQLITLGYAHPVIGFSYDSNVVGAHVKNPWKALYTARAIAQKNGFHLAEFLRDFQEKSPCTAIRLMGHSLGSEVITSAITHMDDYNTQVQSIHLFAASVTRSTLQSALSAIRNVVRGGIKNYYYTADEELVPGHDSGLNPYPVGLCGSGMDGIIDIRVYPDNHRFASYAATLESFP